MKSELRNNLIGPLIINGAEYWRGDVVKLVNGQLASLVFFNERTGKVTVNKYNSNDKPAARLSTIDQSQIVSKAEK